jgi:hypothetical protein
LVVALAGPDAMSSSQNLGCAWQSVSRSVTEILRSRSLP